jgi:thiamine pyrophosphate-dependent acetolactate synthase large subunit-like protein
VATVADHVISALRISGVRRVYGLPGDSLNRFTDAIRRSAQITWEHVRHEETAAFAAAADAALTGQLAVCAGSCGPGNLHLINGLFDAQRSRVPGHRGAHPAHRDRLRVQTLVQNWLPVKVIVFKNSSLNFVELEMKAAGIVNFGTDLVNPNFANVAQAMGIFGRRVEQPADLQQALVDAFAYDGPAIVDVVTARQELSIPPAITVEQAKGFSLYAIRTILAGRGDELLDLITTNVARRILD